MIWLLFFFVVHLWRIQRLFSFSEYPVQLSGCRQTGTRRAVAAYCVVCFQFVTVDFPRLSMPSLLRDNLLEK